MPTKKKAKKKPATKKKRSKSETILKAASLGASLYKIYKSAKR